MRPNVDHKMDASKILAFEALDQHEELPASFPREMAMLERLFGHTSAHLNGVLVLAQAEWIIW